MKVINSVKKFSIGAIIVSLLLGIVFVAFPKQCIEYISIIVGASLIALGVVGIIVFFAADRFILTLITSIISICAGIFICTNYFEIISVIVAIIGVLFVISGIFNFFTSIRVILGSLVFGWVSLFLSIVCTVFGVIAFTHAQETTTTIFQFIGVSFIVYAILDIISYIQVKKLYKKVKTAVDSAANSGNEIETSAEIVED